MCDFSVSGREFRGREVEQKVEGSANGGRGYMGWEGADGSADGGR